MDTSCPLPFVVQLYDTDNPGDVLDALILGRFVAGSEPHAHTVRLPQPSALRDTASARSSGLSGGRGRQVPNTSRRR